MVTAFKAACGAGENDFRHPWFLDWLSDLSAINRLGGGFIRPRGRMEPRMEG
jgi:hypothetical protein